jgi:hypothetical protein
VQTASSTVQHECVSRDCWSHDCHVGLQGNHCRDFLTHDLPKLLEDVPLAVRARAWYMYDGVAAHLSSLVRDVLSNIDHDRWIGRGGPTAWPHPFDFYLWGHLKSPVYAAPADNQ